MDTTDENQVTFDLSALQPRTVMDSFNSSSYYKGNPEIGFGTGNRPPLMNPTCTPGPAAYTIKSTMSKVIESNIKSPHQFSIRSRTKFGDPNEKSMSKSNASEPGPGQYDLAGKFIGGTNPRKSCFPKGSFANEKPSMAPGPGAYGTWGSLGHQILSTKYESPHIGFAKGERGSLVNSGASDVGPGEYGAPRAACEPQIDSRKETCGCLKIGTGYKKGSNKKKGSFAEPSPGPGSYVLPPAIGGKNSRKITLSGRNAFGSPFGK